MTTLRQQFTDLLEPILDDVRNDDDYPRPAQLYSQLYNEIKTSNKAGETRFHRTGLGDFQQKPEGQTITYSDPIAGTPIKVSHVRRALGYKITQEMLDHDQYDEIVKLERDLQIAADDDLEVQGHLLLNNGFGTTDSGGFKAAGFDALSLFNTAHTRLDGGATQRNRPSTDANLSWTSLADAITQFKLWRDHRGRRIISVPQQLWISPQDEMTAREILNSSLKPATSNNEINAIQGALSVTVTQYVTDTNAWFVFGTGRDCFWYWDVTSGTMSASMRDDEEKEIVARKARHGFSMGHGDWFGTYGTSGAS